MKRFSRIKKISFGKKTENRVDNKTGFVAELRRLIDMKQKVPLQYIH